LRIPTPPVPITFKSTDVLIAEAIKAKTIEFDDITQLRPNPRTCIFVRNLSDGTSENCQSIIDTPGFIKMMKETDKIHLLF
jgi:hypothetical protein